MTFQEDEAKVFNCGLLEGALLHFEVETVLMEDVEDSYYNLVMLFFGLTTKDKDVIHVNGHYPFVNKLFEHVLHHHLKGGRVICQAEEHNQGFKETLVHPEGSLPLVSLFNMHVIVSPTDVQFCEIFGFGF